MARCAQRPGPPPARTGWGVLLDRADSVLALRFAYVDQFIGVADVRATAISRGPRLLPVLRSMVEDPVCGGLNAGLAHWLPGAGAVRLPYDVHQGAAVGGVGRLHISPQDEAIWITGATRTLIEGTLRSAEESGEIAWIR